MQHGSIEEMECYSERNAKACMIRSLPGDAAKIPRCKVTHSIPDPTAWQCFTAQNRQRTSSSCQTYMTRRDIFWMMELLRRMWDYQHQAEGYVWVEPIQKTLPFYLKVSSDEQTFPMTFSFCPFSLKGSRKIHWHDEICLPSWWVDSYYAFILTG